MSWANQEEVKCWKKIKPDFSYRKLLLKAKGTLRKSMKICFKKVNKMLFSTGRISLLKILSWWGTQNSKKRKLKQNSRLWKTKNSAFWQNRTNLVLFYQSATWKLFKTWEKWWTIWNLKMTPAITSWSNFSLKYWEK